MINTINNDEAKEYTICGESFPFRTKFDLDTVSYYGVYMEYTGIEDWDRFAKDAADAGVDYAASVAIKLDGEEFVFKTVEDFLYTLRNGRLLTV